MTRIATTETLPLRRESLRELTVDGSGGCGGRLVAA